MTWRAPHPVDLILSNACFHWIDDHLALLDHLLEGPDPVLEWVTGTTLRPILERLDKNEQFEFTTAYSSLLRRAYPENNGATLFPFRRLFVVATRQ